jgi:aspartyl-tRNA synthetase
LGENKIKKGDNKLKTSMKSVNCGELNLANLNEEVTLCCWVSTVRDLGGILFIELRDRSGFFQLVANPQVNPSVHETFSKVKSEYVIQVHGKISKRPE